MLAWVTSGLVAPGVHAGSGSTPAPTARAWHSAPPNGGTDATGALVRAEPLALGEADGEVTSGELTEGGDDEAEADGRDDDGEVVTAQAAGGSSESNAAARLTGFSQRAGRRPPGPPRQARAAELHARRRPAGRAGPAARPRSPPARQAWWLKVNLALHKRGEPRRCSAALAAFPGKFASSTLPG